MREERLIERIRAWNKEPDRRGRNDPNKVIDSVLKHLQRILNTRRGSTQISGEYGIPDFTDFLGTYPDSLREMERAIRQTILRFEPRLKSVRVSFTPQEDESLTLRFQITAQLVMPEERRPVLFQSMIESDGRVNIRS